jgi:hypothetical protein
MATLLKNCRLPVAACPGFSLPNTTRLSVVSCHQPAIAKNAAHLMCTVGVQARSDAVHSCARTEMVCIGVHWCAEKWSAATTCTTPFSKGWNRRSVVSCQLSVVSRKTCACKAAKPHLAQNGLQDWLVRRDKAAIFSGCDSHPAAFAPAGSNRSGGGGNEIAEAFDGKDRMAVPRTGRP